MANLLSAPNRTPEILHAPPLHKRRDPEEWQENSEGATTAQHPQAHSSNHQAVSRREFS